jgi:hypothetical protein
MDEEIAVEIHTSNDVVLRASVRFDFDLKHVDFFVLNYVPCDYYNCAAGMVFSNNLEIVLFACAPYFQDVGLWSQLDI